MQNSLLNWKEEDFAQFLRGSLMGRLLYPEIRQIPGIKSQDRCYGSEIDRMVYQLYELTEEEIEMVKKI